jgi:energy-coupling factor transport system ATP-binding protein
LHSGNPWQAGAAPVVAVLRRGLDRIGATRLLVEHRVDAVDELVDRVVVLAAGGGVIADGAPWQVFARHGDELLAAGVWMPDRPVQRPPDRPRAGPSDTLVLADGATFTWPGAERPALAATDIGLRAAEAVAITGPNGAGKSTLAQLLGGLLRPSGGAVVAGEALAAGHGREPLWRWDARRLVGAIGSVFQDPEHQFLAGSVAEELTLGPVQAGVDPAAARRRADELLQRLHLAHLAEANPFTLSGGEQRRLSVATALAAAPSVLILDEPTFGQDRRTWVELLDLLAALRDEGRAVCVVTHDLSFASLLADRVVTLEPPR